MFAGSSYRTKINKAILVLQYDGSLKIMYDKWWGKKTLCEVKSQNFWPSAVRALPVAADTNKGGHYL